MTYDNLDNQLINLLLSDGRASLRSLGEGLDVSVTTVSNHINDLEAGGVIEGYTPIINYAELGYDVTAIMQLKVEGAALSEIVDRLRDQEQMISVYEVTGDYDIIAIGKFGDTNGMNAQIKELLADIDIRESNTSVVLNAVKETSSSNLTSTRSELLNRDQLWQ
jgi:Transcriptional regulators